MMHEWQVAFATGSSSPTVTEDDALAAKACLRQGIVCGGAAWDDPAVDWSRFDAVVLRSTWNYYMKLAEFLQWYRVCSDKCLVFNPVDLVFWNSDKRYLLRLAEAGFDVPRTVIVSNRDATKLSELLRTHRWRAAVIKPSVSANAFETALVTWDSIDAAEAQLERMLLNGDVLLQEFMEEIRGDGEMSLMFFNGIFSHAVLKSPTANEFRVQEHAGGSVLAANPSAAVISSASSILRHVSAAAPLYARVDGIVTNDRFVLMELELIEPDLFFRHSRPSADTFARELAGRLQNRRA